jgi:hypothetical protein
VKRINRGMPSTETNVGAGAGTADSGTLPCCAVGNDQTRKVAVAVTSKDLAMLDGIRNLKGRFDGNIASDRFLRIRIRWEGLTLSSRLPIPFSFWEYSNVRTVHRLGCLNKSAHLDEFCCRKIRWAVTLLTKQTLQVDLKSRLDRL